MKKLFLLIALLFAFDAEAAKRIPSPECPYTGHASCSDGIDNDHDGTVDEAAPSAAFSAVTGGYAADIKDCQLLTYTTTASDTESSSGTFVSKASSNNHDIGQIACAGNFSNGSYYIWLKLRFRGVTQLAQRVVWLNTSAFTAGFQNSRASFISEILLPAAPSFGFVSIGDTLDFTTSTNGTAATTLTLNGNTAIFIVANEAIEMDCLYVSTSSTATPICPVGAPASGVTFDAVGTASSGSAVTSLTPTITVGSDANRYLLCGIGHRTSTNTISSVSSSVDGALTLLDWHSSTSGNTVAAALYYKIAPTAGAHTITVTFSSAQNAVANCVSYEGVSQTAPASAVTTTSGSLAAASHSMGSATDNIGLAHYVASIATSAAITPNASQTERWESTAGIDSTANRVSALSAKQGDSNVTLSWSDNATSRVWIIQGVSLQPPSVSGSAPTMGTPSTVLVGIASATVRASIDDASATCQAEYEADGGTSPPYTSSTSSIGPTGGFCEHTITGLTEGTDYVYRINGTNATGTTNSSEGTFTTKNVVTALGITQAEIDQWLVRTTAGPYRATGDVSANSPGEWNSFILPYASTLVSSPTGSQWTGQTTNVSWYADLATKPDPPFSREYKSRHAAAGIAYAATGSTSYKDALLTALLAQAAQAGTDFSNTTRWPNGVATDSRIHDVGRWLGALATGYSFIRNDISAGNRTTLDTWFCNAAKHIDETASNIAEKRYPNRDADDYATAGVTTPANQATTFTRLLYFGGPTTSGFQEGWSNRGLGMIVGAFKAALVSGGTCSTIRDSGILITTSAKRWFRETFIYAVFPQSGETHHSDYRRWTTATPTQGWSYTAGLIIDLIALADISARLGDDSLMEYSTSDGVTSASSTVGGPKSLRSLVATNLKYVDGTLTNYGTDVTANNGNAAYKIGPNDGLSGRKLAKDRGTARANIYWNDANIKAIYMRIKSGTPAYSATIADIAGDYDGDPAQLFMWGQLEGVIDPYP